MSVRILPNGRGTPGAPRILIADDEPDLVWSLHHVLAGDGYDLATATDGVEAVEAAREHRPDLIILDINMPRMDGIEVCRALRRDPTLASVPILFLTVRAAVEDKVKGLDMGADDYLCKPFEIEELQSRVRALLRRVELTRPRPAAEAPVVHIGELRLDVTAHVLTVSGRPVTLTPAEFKLLKHLMTHPFEVYTGRQLLESVWGYHPGTGDPALVRWHIKNLRNKIEADPAHPKYIRTQGRFGYTLDERASRRPSGQAE